MHSLEATGQEGDKIIIFSSGSDYVKNTSKVLSYALLSNDIVETNGDLQFDNASGELSIVTTQPAVSFGTLVIQVTAKSNAVYLSDEFQIEVLCTDNYLNINTPMVEKLLIERFASDS